MPSTIEVSSSTLFSPNAVVHVEVPEGIRLVQDCNQDTRLVATRAFRCGETVFETEYVLQAVPEPFYWTVVTSNGGKYRLFTTTHSVDNGDGRNRFYYYDSFMNHSCDPNTRSLELPHPMSTSKDSRSVGYYAQVALKDIAEGDELTCDYDVLEYVSRPCLNFCGCQSPNCRGRIAGFKYLSLTEMKRLRPHLMDSVFNGFMRLNYPSLGTTKRSVMEKLFDEYYFTERLRSDANWSATQHHGCVRFEPGAVIDVNVPEGLSIKKTACGYGLVATQAFKKGETLYAGYYELVPDVPFSWTMRTLTETFQLESFVHGVATAGGKRQIFYFDSFMNHSCDPNTSSVDDDGDRCMYKTVALRDIEEGEEITCDYCTFEWDTEGFDCSCGASRCVRSIRGFKNLLTHIQLEKESQWEGDSSLLYAWKQSLVA